MQIGTGRSGREERKERRSIQGRGRERINGSGSSLSIKHNALAKRARAIALAKRARAIAQIVRAHTPSGMHAP
eukprot:3186832-Pleurochrysis_carterae.AAC.2